jgi:hypothetical protein
MGGRFQSYASCSNYGMLVLGGSVLIAFVPGFREALVAPIAAAPASEVDRARRRAENR